MTVARLTFLADNFVVRCYQVTKLFGTWDWITGALSARIPGNFGPSAYVEISVLREMCEHIMFHWFHFWKRFWNTRLPRAGSSGTEASSSTKFKVNSNHFDRFSPG